MPSPLIRAEIAEELPPSDTNLPALSNVYLLVFAPSVIVTPVVPSILFSMVIQILAVIIQIKGYSISSRIVKLVFVIISFGISNVLRKSIVKKIDSYVN